MYKAVIKAYNLGTTKTLLNAFRIDPQINEIISKHSPFGVENARMYLYPLQEHLL